MGGGAQLLRGELFQMRAEITDLRKFAVLNYVAVIKAVKKRNRHLGAQSQQRLRADARHGRAEPAVLLHLAQAGQAGHAGRDPVPGTSPHAAASSAIAPP